MNKKITHYFLQRRRFSKVLPERNTEWETIAGKQTQADIFRELSEKTKKKPSTMQFRIVKTCDEIIYTEEQEQ